MKKDEVIKTNIGTMNPEEHAQPLDSAEPALILQFPDGTQKDWFKLSWTYKRKIARKFPAFVSRMNKMAKQISDDYAAKDREAALKEKP